MQKNSPGMKITTKAILSIGITCVIWYSAVVVGLVAKVCKPGYKGYRYVEGADGTGSCEKCPDCGTGQEWNRRAVVPTSDYGALVCPPCVPCRDGYYKEIRSTLRTCKRCMLNCYEMNRLEGQRCGGTDKGFCNSCLPGYKETARDIYTPCMRDLDVWEEPAVPTSGHDQHASPTPEQRRQVTSTPEGLKEISDVQPVKGSPLKNRHDNGPPISVYLVIVGIGFVAVVVFYNRIRTWKWISGLCQETKNVGESSKDLLSTTTGSLGTDNPTISEGKDKLLGPVVTYDHVLSIEELMGGRDDKPREEENSQTTDSAEEASDSDEIDGPAEKNDVQVPQLRLDKDHAALDLVAGKVYPEEDYQLFRNLNLQKYDWKPERELYYCKKQAYKESVLNALIVWTQREGNKATLDVLVEAVQQAGFIDIADELRQKYGSEPPAVWRPAIQDDIACRAELPQRRSLQGDHHVNIEGMPMIPCRGEFPRSTGIDTASDANNMAAIPFTVTDDSLSLASLFKPSLDGAISSTKL